MRRSPSLSGVRAVGAAKLSAVDLATAEVRRSIVAGDLPPGQPFSVNDLAARLGVSHIPVREALRRLEAEGLVELQPARSAVVTRLDITDLRSVYRLRCQLEPPLAARSAGMRERPDIEELHRLHAAAFSPAGDPEVQWASHGAFHRALVEPAASAWDLRFLEQLWAASARYTRLVFDPASADHDDQSHRADVHRLLLDQDGDRVEAFLRAHLMENLATIEASLLRRS
ncbi:MAG TPA: GntR family transcriptional regulator [Trebonia sp.]|nr:GntR family transcriptional regulator [Trebonia sp.]